MKHEPLPERKPLVDVKPPAKAALLANGKADEMTEYERKRLENIQRNLDFMKSMGVSTVCGMSLALFLSLRPRVLILDMHPCTL
jgi:hypothetical protein